LSIRQHNQNVFSLTAQFNMISVTFVSRSQVYPKGNKDCLNL
jgi:hypothetical protein